MATISYLVQRYLGGSWQDWPGARILPGLKITTDFGGTPESPIAWGAIKPPEATILLTSVASELATAYTDLPVRIQAARGGSLATVYVGIVQGKDETVSLTTNEVAYTAVGLGERVRRTRAISPLLYRRPAATLTTLTSIEDPTNASWAGGLMNYAFWKAGLRPYAQAASYPSAVGYYHCDHAVIAPEWTWLNGEDAYAECGELARSVGGVITQTPDGVVRFLSPLGTMVGSVAATLSEGASAGLAGALYYTSLKRSSKVAATYGRVRVPWAFRSRRAQAEAWRQPQRIRVPGLGENSSYSGNGWVDIEFQTDYPMYAWDGFSATDDAYYMSEAGAQRMAASDFSQWPITATRNTAEGKYCRFRITELGAQRVIGRFEHTYPEAIHLDTLVVEGQPVIVAHEGEHVSGSSGLELSYRANLYISSQRHAQMLGDMLVAFNSVARPVTSAGDVLFGPAVAAGTKVYLHGARMGITPAVLHLVTHHSITLGLGSLRMDVDAIPIGDLPSEENIWKWGDSLGSGPKGCLW